MGVSRVKVVNRVGVHFENNASSQFQCWPCTINKLTYQHNCDNNQNYHFSFLFSAFSALTLLAGPQQGHPASKKLGVGCWGGGLSGARCRLAYVPADATATHCIPLQ